MSKMKAVQLDDQERLLIIDQTRLPSELVFMELDDKGSLVDAIARLKVRGAPAIGIAAAYGVYVLARSYRDLEREVFISALYADIAELRQVRPTAVNLAWALGRMAQTLRLHQQEEITAILAALKAEAMAIDHFPCDCLFWRATDRGGYGHSYPLQCRLAGHQRAGHGISSALSGSSAGQKIPRLL